MNPKYPIFIPTKNRYKKPFTIGAFDAIGVPYRIVIEEQEYDEYRKVVTHDRILVVPHKNEGLTVTRNWIWDFAQAEGHERFWTFDDNIAQFFRLNRNIKWRMKTGTHLKIIEDFVERYENIAIAGMQYEKFAPRKTKIPPFRLNTRIYSNMLIKTDIPFRNECFYNDDTDLCIRVLRAGYCTLLMQAFLADKLTTMRVQGGMTDYYNETDKRREFAEELQRKHPDLVEVAWKFNRWHHQVNYKPFLKNKLIRKKGLEIKQGINNYGLILKERGANGTV